MSRVDRNAPAGVEEVRAQSSASWSRYAVLLAVTVSLPFIVLAVIELALRALSPGGGLPLFVHAAVVKGDYLVANRAVGERWFSNIDNPPTPAHEVFARQKPANGFRVFVMGESAAAGFPYPRNAEFSRELADVLRDALPSDSVEVINVAIAATNTFELLDLAGEIAAQHPDAVLIYAGHNEYYGVLGTASRVRFAGSDALVRLYLRALHLRTVLALRNGISRLLAGRGKKTPGVLEAASLMEILARDRQIPVGSARYTAGTKQFQTNLETICRIFERNGIRVFVGSLVSNLRDQPPFAAAANGVAGAADSTFALARIAAAKGDSAVADSLFIRARDLDVVRFRAPSEFNSIIRRVATLDGVTYVPIAEAFAAASPFGAPGSNIFLEHVHPTRQGQALMGRIFFESLLHSGVLGAKVDTTRIRSWDEYSRAMDLTGFDEQIAIHTTRTLKSHWPFVPVAEQTDYRGTYVPTSLLDSLAFAVSAGERWEIAKVRLGESYERGKEFDSAAAEYAGLVRDAPFVSEPWLLEARALSGAGKLDEAEASLKRAVAITPNPAALNFLGKRAAQRRDLTQAISYFERSLEIDAAQPEALYELSLTYAIAGQLGAARQRAQQLGRVAPGYPALPRLLRALGSPQ